MEVSTGCGTTGVVGLLAGDKGGDCIGLRADMDCLRLQEKSGVAHASKRKDFMHGCGHDGHVASLVGAAHVLAKMADLLPCPVKFIFQPGEENGAGAKKMIDDGVLEEPRVRTIFGLHGTPSLPLGTFGLRTGPMMAVSSYFRIVIRGEGTHAAMPHKGKDMVLVASHIVCAAHSIVSRSIDPLEAALLSIPIFNGSQAANVLPEEVVLEGTLRSLSDRVLATLQRRLSEVVEGCSRAFGATAQVSFSGGYPLLVNEGRSADYLARMATEVVGTARVKREYAPSLGAEDFAYYLQSIPGAFCWFGLGRGGTDEPPLHSPYFDFNDEALPLAMELLCRLALHGRECF
ncbi:unnamed protein product [Cyprideis torosa]|uniref:Uncharacterized protein n=1 Tax=Cyprideis torosa TaxID=163714 RepID=A0A7R8WMS5_9CRUS|nr:unnamed protein product [Cyprideis torosa]CAG0899800.1 unnamed protein product [Cyprideis torosa]